jgi:hypothetical protein
MLSDFQIHQDNLEFADKMFQEIIGIAQGATDAMWFDVLSSLKDVLSSGSAAGSDGPNAGRSEPAGTFAADPPSRVKKSIVSGPEDGRIVESVT